MVYNKVRMKQSWWVGLVLILLLGGAGVFFWASRGGQVPVVIDQQNEALPKPTAEVGQAEMSNPAADNCVNNGGELELVTAADGSQFGMCNLGDYECEEWAYFRNECDVEGDAAKIEAALRGKGLNLTGMKVVIKKHLGKEIEGAVVPVSEPAGGGYVFAIKTDEGVKVLADGNGVIRCSAFEDYPEYSTYLVAECVDDAGRVVVR